MELKEGHQYLLKGGVKATYIGCASLFHVFFFYVCDRSFTVSFNGRNIDEYVLGETE